MKVPIPIECTSQSSGAKIVCNAKGRMITFLNPKRRRVVRYLIDDCAELRASLENSACKLCDFLVVDWRREEHYVELKGRNVEHALKQLKATIPQLSLANANGRVYCWIITTESPSTQSKFQVLKQKFEKQFKARLTIRTNKFEHKLEK